MPGSQRDTGTAQAPRASADAPVDAGRAERDRMEQELIAARREAFGLPGPGEQDSGATVGMALSGGGIRSATFSLGILQAMAAAGILRRIDYFSTVSGGGYTGGFRGARLRATARTGSVDGAEAVRRGYALAVSVLTGDEGRLELEVDADVTPARRTVFHPNRWLREAGRYLAPTRSNDWL